MSGTSLDGVDAALVDFSSSPWRLVATHYQPFPSAIRDEALALNSAGSNELDRAGRLSVALAEIYATAVNDLLAQAGAVPARIAAIGCHGQTVRHRPDRGYTVQLGNAARVAELTGIRVVADFRSRDIAAGGHGAPLVPAFHRAVFGSKEEHRVVVNIGGIANITDLPPDGSASGFDTGPGNVLLDLNAAAHTSERYDAGGALSAGGIVDYELLAKLMAEPYFAALPPKSTGRDLFHRGWLDRHLGTREVHDARTVEPADLQATLAELTAWSIADAIERYCTSARRVFVCGGGAHNTDLLKRLAARLGDRGLESTELLGVSPDWVEAYAFAWLARCADLNETGNLPAVTGAAGARVLGAIYPA
jgi:anhydro-N-acetylmuramic acid kinase